MFCFKEFCEGQKTGTHQSMTTLWLMLNRFPRLQSSSQQLQLIISRRNSTVTYLKLHRQHHTFTFLMKNISLSPITFFVETLYFIRYQNSIQASCQHKTSCESFFLPDDSDHKNEIRISETHVTHRTHHNDETSSREIFLVLALSYFICSYVHSNQL